MDINSSATNEIYAFFRERSRALDAIGNLKEAGFTSDEIGLAMTDQTASSVETNTVGDPARASDEGGFLASESGSREIDNRSMWDKMKDFFTGRAETYSGDERAFQQAYGDISEERCRYYNSGIEAGGALVSVFAPIDRVEQAKAILNQHGGDLRTSGFEETSGIGSAGLRSARTEQRASGRTGSDLGSSTERRIQLRGEMLRAVKQRVAKGEVRLRKEVIVENQTMNVPVTREEVIVERVDAEGVTPISGRIGDEGEIRIPVSEETVDVVKEPVVTGEVRVQKRTVEENQQVKDAVRHEEVRVENEGDVRLDDKDSTRTKEFPKRKKPAA